MKTVFIVRAIVTALAVLIIGAFFLFFRGPDLTSYLALKEPRIGAKAKSRRFSMLVPMKPNPRISRNLRTA